MGSLPKWEDGKMKLYLESDRLAQKCYCRWTLARVAPKAVTVVCFYLRLPEEISPQLPVEIAGRTGSSLRFNEDKKARRIKLMFG